MISPTSKLGVLLIQRCAEIALKPAPGSTRWMFDRLPAPAAGSEQREPRCGLLHAGSPASDYGRALLELAARSRAIVRVARAEAIARTSSLEMRVAPCGPATSNRSRYTRTARPRHRAALSGHRHRRRLRAGGLLDFQARSSKSVERLPSGVTMTLTTRKRGKHELRSGRTGHFNSSSASDRGTLARIHPSGRSAVGCRHALSDRIGTPA